MSGINFNKYLSENAFKQFAETFHLAFALTPFATIVVSLLIGTDKLLIEFGFILLSIVINFLLLQYKAKTVQKDNKEISLFHTFWFNSLKPYRIEENKGKENDISGDDKNENEVFFNINVAVIEAQNEKLAKKLRYYSDALIRKFEEKPKSNNHERVTDKVTGLDFKFLHCNPFSKNNEIIRSPKQLKENLGKFEAVVVVRTKELDEIDWVYNTIESWAYEHSEIPILFARALNDELEFNEIANRFKPITDDAKSLPWYLLKRANDRGKNWRTQATFNRALAWNIAYSVILLMYFGLISVKGFYYEDRKNKIDTQTLTEGFNHIASVKNEFHDKIIKYSVNQIHKEDLEQTKIDEITKNVSIDVYISYWFTHEKEPNIFVTTEADGTKDKFPLDTASIIGCGFVNKNRIIDWSRENGSKTITNVWKFDKTQDKDTRCEMTELDNSPIDNIVCATYTDENYPDLPIGICMFTKLNQQYSKEQVTLMFEEETRMFLYEKSKNFFAKFRKEIISMELIPQSQRKVDEVKQDKPH
jgi:hypothetical protein